MTTAEKIAKYEAQIEAAETAIDNMLKTGNKYKIESAKSNREFEGFSLKDLEDYIARREGKIKGLSGTGGFVGLF